MKALTLICTIAVIALTFYGCVGDGMFQSESTIANAQMDAILCALENRDAEQLTSLFAKNALSEVENFQSAVDSLFSYYQGNHTSYNNWGATNSSTEREGNHQIRKIYGTYDVTTNTGTYRFAFLYVVTDTLYPDNVGLRSVYVIKMEEDTDPQCAYRGDDLYTPGIQIGIPNKLPVEE